MEGFPACLDTAEVTGNSSQFSTTPQGGLPSPQLGDKKGLRNEQ
jgi:hypothetical protein